jgi:dihydro-heme d1 dehydrogenase
MDNLFDPRPRPPSWIDAPWRTLFRWLLLVFVLLLLAWIGKVAAEPTAQSLYAEHCATCHGADRLGAMGPALLPENLERLRRPAAEQVIAEGRPATQMPRFADKLSSEQIKQLAELIYAPLPQMPVWDMREISASRIQHRRPDELTDHPQFDADPLNLFVVVEAGDHHATILDGDRLEPLVRFPTRFALHGGPKFSPDGRYVYFASRDGWISKYDLWGLTMVAEIRAGKSSRVSAVYDAGPRGSFVVALKDIPELWEVFYTEQHDPVYQGLVHDYRGGEALADVGPFPVRRTRLDDYLDDFFFDASYAYVIGAAREGGKGQVVNLDVRRKIAAVDLPGLPHLGSGISWEREGRPVMATPNLKQGLVSVIDMKTWTTVKQIDTLGPGFFLRSHENTPYAWVDALNSPAKDALQVIDKRTLEVVRTLRPAPGKSAAHVEFTRDGRYALVSLWEMDGALIVYDAQTLEEVKRIPMRKPVGKYNVFNKITHSSGTSH